MLRSAVNGDILPAAASALARYGYLPPARKIIARYRRYVCRDLCWRSRGDNLSAVDPRTRSDIHDVIALEHRLLIVLNDYDAVAHIAQIFKCGYQLPVVALMQTDARLVKHVKHADKRRAYLRCESDALRLAARKRSRLARKIEIFEP